MTRYYSDYRPYGYAFHAELYCGICGHDLPDTDPEGNPKHPIASWELNELNTDFSATCHTCHSITSEWMPA